MHQEAKLNKLSRGNNSDSNSVWIIQHTHHVSPWLHMVSIMDARSKNENNIIALFIVYFQSLGVEEECCRNLTKESQPRLLQSHKSKTLLHCWRFSDGCLATVGSWWQDGTEWCITWPSWFSDPGDICFSAWKGPLPAIIRARETSVVFIMWRALWNIFFGVSVCVYVWAEGDNLLWYCQCSACKPFSLQPPSAP